MKYIANILTDEPFSEGELYNIVRESNFLVPGIPTLIIGWDKTKELYPDASIIEWKVAENTYWTYGRYEKRDRYETNLKRFQELAFKKFVESVNYVFYDILTTSESKFSSFLSSLSSNLEKTAYVSNDMLYICYEGKEKVVGISLRDCDYLDTTTKKRIFSAIYNNKAIRLLKNNDDISKEIRQKTRGRAYLLAYIYS